MKITCPCLFGLESVLKFEIAKLGGENITVTDGRVSFDGDLSLVAAANLRLSTAERVLIELKSFEAKSFEELYDAVKTIPLEEFAGANDAFPVKGHALSSKLMSVPDCQRIIKKALADRLMKKYGKAWLSETGAVYKIQFNILKDVVHIYLDTTGAALHKRGYRRNSNEAPIKETLAAGIIDFARVRRDSVVLDPMCGSGTLLIESAFKALGVPCGFRRRFACESWQAFDNDIFKAERARAMDLIDRKGGFKALGFDIDPECVALTLDNAKKAGVGSKFSIKQQDISRLKLPKGVITVCNPPYGERMLDVKNAEVLYKRLGEKLHPDKDNPCYIISPHENFESFFGKKADKQRKLYNGMIKCRLYMYFK